MNRKVNNADLETSLNMFNVRDRAATKVSNPLHLNLSALHTDTIDRVSATSRNQQSERSNRKMFASSRNIGTFLLGE